MVLRLVPTFEVAALAEISGAETGVNSAMGLAYQAAVGGQFSHSQIWNPAGSGVILLISYMAATTTITTELMIGRHDTALTTLSASKQWVDSRRSGLPVGQTRAQASVASLGNVLWAARVPSDQYARVHFANPLVLGPGQGMHIRTNAFNDSCYGSFLWREERA